MRGNFVKFLLNLNYKSIYLFLIVFIILTIGVVYYSGTKHIDKLILVILSFGFSYYLLSKINLFNKLFHIEIKSNIIKDHYLFILSLSMFLIDIFFLGGVPVLVSLKADTVSEFCNIRNSIHQDTPILWVYLSNLNMKALLPFSLFHFLYKKNNLLFSLTLVLAIFYAFAMMQKSFILVVLMPALILSIFSKKYIYSLFMLCSISIIVLFSTYSLNRVIDNEAEMILNESRSVSNQIIEENDHEVGIRVRKSRVENNHGISNTNADDSSSSFNKVNVESEVSFFLKIIGGLSTRIFIIPGSTVNSWFDIIPSKKPFLYGDGYPFLAKIRGHEYHNYSKELFPIMKPEYAEKKLIGTVNVASFVREYADFGYFGLILGGLLISLFLVSLDMIFKSFPIPYYALNLFPIFLLSSSSILTLFFSGGWGLIVFLFFIFKHQYKTN